MDTHFACIAAVQVCSDLGVVRLKTRLLQDILLGAEKGVFYWEYSS